LRLSAAVKAEAEKVAAAASTTLNQVIGAEKRAALWTAKYFQDQAFRADLSEPHSHK
jgi:hypothetical protein